MLIQTSADTRRLAHAGTECIPSVLFQPDDEDKFYQSHDFQISESPLY